MGKVMFEKEVREMFGETKLKPVYETEGENWIMVISAVMIFLIYTGIISVVTIKLADVFK